MILILASLTHRSLWTRAAKAFESAGVEIPASPHQTYWKMGTLMADSFVLVGEPGLDAYGEAKSAWFTR